MVNTNFDPRSDSKKSRVPISLFDIFNLGEVKRLIFRHLGAENLRFLSRSNKVIQESVRTALVQELYSNLNKTGVLKPTDQGIQESENLGLISRSDQGIQEKVRTALAQQLDSILCQTGNPNTTKGLSVTELLFYFFLNRPFKNGDIKIDLALRIVKGNKENSKRLFNILDRFQSTNLQAYQKALFELRQLKDDQKKMLLEKYTQSEGDPKPDIQMALSGTIQPGNKISKGEQVSSTDDLYVSPLKVLAPYLDFQTLCRGSASKVPELWEMISKILPKLIIAMETVRSNYQLIQNFFREICKDLSDKEKKIIYILFLHSNNPKIKSQAVQLLGSNRNNWLLFVKFGGTQALIDSFKMVEPDQNKLTKVLDKISELGCKLEDRWKSHTDDELAFVGKIRMDVIKTFVVRELKRIVDRFLISSNEFKYSYYAMRCLSNLLSNPEIIQEVLRTEDGKWDMKNLFRCRNDQAKFLAANCLIHSTLTDTSFNTETLLEAMNILEACVPTFCFSENREVLELSKLLLKDLLKMIKINELKEKAASVFVSLFNVPWFRNNLIDFEGSNADWFRLFRGETPSDTVFSKSLKEALIGRIRDNFDTCVAILIYMLQSRNITLVGQAEEVINHCFKDTQGMPNRVIVSDKQKLTNAFLSNTELFCCLINTLIPNMSDIQKIVKKQDICMNDLFEILQSGKDDDKEKIVIAMNVLASKEYMYPLIIDKVDVLLGLMKHPNNDNIKFNAAVIATLLKGNSCYQGLVTHYPYPLEIFQELYEKYQHTGSNIKQWAKFWEEHCTAMNKALGDQTLSSS